MRSPLHFLRACGVALAVLLATPVVVAEVTASSAGGFVSQHTLQLAASPDDAYRALTSDVGAWWDADHSHSGRASNFFMDTRAGGCFCERLDGGGVVEHMRVVFLQPGKRLRLAGGLGPLQEMAVTGSMTFDLAPSEGGTLLSYTYAVGGFVPGGLDKLANAVDAVQLGQLKRLQAYLGAVAQ